MTVNLRNRIIFIIAWILSILGITFYGGVVSYSIFALLTIIPVVSLLYLLYVIYFFRIYQKLDCRWIAADQRVPFFFSLVNEYHMGFVGLRVRFYSSFSTITGLDDSIEYELPPKSGINKHTELICKYRGEYEAGIKSIEVQDYLRLIKLTYKNKEPLRVIVRPKLVYVDEIKSMDLVSVLTNDRQFQDTDPDVLVRKYESGDDIRQINWKASARSGELMVRNRIGQEQQGVTLLFSTYRGSEDIHAYLPLENKILETVLALSAYMGQKRIPLQALYLHRELVHLRLDNLDMLDRFYEQISAISFDQEDTEKKLLMKAAGGHDIFSSKAVVMVLEKWSVSATNLAKLLGQNGINVYVVIVSDKPESCDTEGLTHIKITNIAIDQDLQEVL